MSNEKPTTPSASDARPLTRDEFRAKFAGQQPPDAWLGDDAADLRRLNESLAEPGERRSLDDVVRELEQ